jgi:hypothetical protein
MDHLDKLDYASLSFCVAAFLFAVIAIWAPETASADRSTADKRKRP